MHDDLDSLVHIVLQGEEKLFMVLSNLSFQLDLVVLDDYVVLVEHVVEVVNYFILSAVVLVQVYCNYVH